MTVKGNVCEEQTSRRLEKAVIVHASAEAIWRAWTTSEGAKEFFAPEATIELHPGGKYEILFDLEASPGSKGSEGCQVVSYKPLRELILTWNNPPEFKEIRNCYARVTIEIEPLDAVSCRLMIVHDDWGKGGQWEEAFNYFDRAWDVVLRRLVERFSSGPIDWPSVGH